MTKPGFKVVGGLAVLAIVALEVTAVAKWQGWFGPRPNVVTAIAPVSTGPVTSVTEARAPIRPPVTAGAPSVTSLATKSDDRYYAQLRGKVRWVETRLGKGTAMTPDLNSRMLLVKSAAQRARLDQVGLSFADVYGLISAETSWVPRTGMGKNGSPSHGIAQFEPATARALGLRNPNDLVEAVHVAARHMKEAAVWSEDRIGGLKLSADERAAKLREGVSIYYNLSSRGRRVWNGKNTSRLPVETRRHILNTRIGAHKASLLAAGLPVPGNGRGDAQTVAALAGAAQRGG